jgi:hypothetical protein
VQFSKDERALYQVRYTADNLRAAESAALNHTPHYFVRTNLMAHTMYQMWACVKCGNERVYGAEEA